MSFKGTKDTICNVELQQMLKMSTDPFSSKKMVQKFVSVSQRIKRQFLRNAGDLLLSFWVFGTAHSTDLNINVSTQVEPYFVRKKQNVQHKNVFL
jgi:hypothetical protein